MQKQTQSKQTSNDKFSHLMVISHTPQHFSMLMNVLQYYFPSKVSERNSDDNNNNQKQNNSVLKSDQNLNQNHQHLLHIQNKYYKADIQCHNELWSGQQKSSIKKNQQQVDEESQEEINDFQQQQYQSLQEQLQQQQESGQKQEEQKIQKEKQQEMQESQQKQQNEQKGQTQQEEIGQDKQINQQQNKNNSDNNQSSIKPQQESKPVNINQLSNTIEETTVPLSSSANRFDFLIMLISYNSNKVDQINYSTDIDKTIKRFNPDQFMILLDTEGKIKVHERWQQEDTIMEKCDNFVEIVKEDLKDVLKNRPKWERGALLANKGINEDDEGDDEEGEDFQRGMFSLLDRLQTTRWAEMEQKKISKKEENKKEKEEICNNLAAESGNGNQRDTVEGKYSSEQVFAAFSEKSEQPIKQLQQPSQQKQCPQEQEHTQKNEEKSKLNSNQNQTATAEEKNSAATEVNNEDQPQEETPQVSEEQLQREMAQFESMVGEMHAFKAQAQSMPINQRKDKAEQLFSKMFGGSFQQI